MALLFLSCKRVVVFFSVQDVMSNANNEYSYRLKLVNATLVLD